MQIKELLVFLKETSEFTFLPEFHQETLLARWLRGSGPRAEKITGLGLLVT